MFGIVRYLFTIVATFCVAALCGERAFGQVPQVVPIPTRARPQVPNGFTAEPATSEMREPQVIREAPNGDLFVVDTMFDAVHVLRTPPSSAHAIRDEVFASGLKQPFGIAFDPERHALPFLPRHRLAHALGMKIILDVNAHRVDDRRFVWR